MKIVIDKILFSKRIILKKCWFGFLYTQIQKQTQSILKILSPDLGDVMAFKIGAGVLYFCSDLGDQIVLEWKLGQVFCRRCNIQKK